MLDGITNPRWKKSYFGKSSSSSLLMPQAISRTSTAAFLLMEPYEWWIFLSQQVHKYTENFQQDYATEKQQTSLESWNIEDFKNMRDIAVTLTIKKLCAQSWFQTFKLLTILKVLMMLTKSFEKYLSFKNLIHQMTGFQLLKDNCSSLVPMPIAQIETWVAADCTNV